MAGTDHPDPSDEDCLQNSDIQSTGNQSTTGVAGSKRPVCKGASSKGSTWLSAEELAGTPESLERVRADKAWANYIAFLESPGHKCANCWLLSRHCCCDGMQKIRLRPRVLVVFHYLELGRHLCSNTAKLLLSFGGEAFCWGTERHDEMLSELLREDPSGTVILFPTPDAVDASTLVGSSEIADRSTRLAEESLAGRADDAMPRRIVVLDGGWRECKRMNEWLDPALMRIKVNTATREEYGGTRKYGTNKDSDGGRVQTAAAFVALLQELGEESSHIAALKASLAHFLSCYEAQISRSKT